MMRVVQVKNLLHLGLFAALLVVASAGNKERNLWTAILMNKIDDIAKHLDNGANPNSKNEVKGDLWGHFALN